MTDIISNYKINKSKLVKNRIKISGTVFCQDFRHLKITVCLGSHTLVNAVMSILV